MAFFWYLGTSNYYLFLSFRGGSVVKSSTKLLFQRIGVRFPAPRGWLTTVCHSNSRVPVLVKKTNRGGYTVFMDGDKEACIQKPAKPGHTGVQHQLKLAFSWLVSHLFLHKQQAKLWGINQCIISHGVSISTHKRVSKE